MNCPRCKEKMATSTCDGIDTNTCLYCNGVWLNSKSLETLLKKEHHSPSKIEIQKSFAEQYDKNSNRNCPECKDEKLYQIHTHGVELDLCPECSGLFFDEGELKHVLPNVYKSNFETGLSTSDVSESLFWILLGIMGGGF